MNYFKKIPLVTGTLEEGLYFDSIVFSTDSRRTQLSPAGIDLVPVTSMETLTSTLLGIRSDAQFAPVM